MVKSVCTGRTKVKRIDASYGTNYFIQLTKKGMNGKLIHADKKVKFLKGVEIEDGEEIEIINGFESFNINPKTKRPALYLVCTEFERVLLKDNFVKDSGKTEVLYEDLEFDDDDEFTI